MIDIIHEKTEGQELSTYGSLTTLISIEIFVKGIKISLKEDFH